MCDQQRDGNGNGSTGESLPEKSTTLAPNGTYNDPIIIHVAICRTYGRLQLPNLNLPIYFVSAASE